MEDVESGKPDVRKLQKSVSYDLSEDDDFNSVADSDAEENSNGLKRSVGYVSIAMHDDFDPLNSGKKVGDAEDSKSQAESTEPCGNSINNKLNSELTSFVQKKSFAQNMMDIALLSANTNQLRYVIDLGEKHPYYSTSLCLIILSLVMQVVVGLSMLYMSRYNMKNKSEMKEASHMNNLSVAGVFLVTLVNVFISTFNGTGVPPHAARNERQGSGTIVRRQPANVDVGKCGPLAALEAVRRAYDPTVRVGDRNGDAALGGRHSGRPSALAEAARRGPFRRGVVPVLCPVGDRFASARYDWSSVKVANGGVQEDEPKTTDPMPSTCQDTGDRSRKQTLLLVG